MRLSEIVIACHDIQKMHSFYMQVFNIQFREVKSSQGKMYEGFSDVKFVLCPEEIAGISVNTNRHQLTFSVTDINECIKLVEKYSGTFLSEPVEFDGSLQIAIRDPDGNSMVLKQEN